MADAHRTNADAAAAAPADAEAPPGGAQARLRDIRRGAAARAEIAGSHLRVRCRCGFVNLGALFTAAQVPERAIS